MQQLNCRQDSRAGASVPCYTLRQWVSLYGELLFRQERELQEHLHLDENTTVGWGGLQLAYTPQRCHPWERGGGHKEEKGLSSKGKLVMPEIFMLWINLHQINAATHWQSRYPEGDRFHRVLRWEFGVSADSRKHESIIVSFSFSLRNMISGGDDEGGNWAITKANIQSRRDNKRKTKDSSGWQDAPGAAMLLLCWKGLLSCGVGQLGGPEDWVGEGPAQQPVHEVFSAQRKGGTNLPNTAAVAFHKNKERRRWWWWIYELK